MNIGRADAWRQLLVDSGLGRFFLSGDPDSLQMRAEVRHLVEESKRKEVWDTPLDELAYTIIDTETTGFNPRTDHILSIACVEMTGDEIGQGNFSSFIRLEEGVVIPDAVSDLTGIRREMLETAPMLSDVLHRFLSFTGDAVLVAHHARHDMGFLNEAMLRCYRTSVSHRVLDTAVVAQIVHETRKPWTFDRLTAYYKIEGTDRHTAVGDANTLARAWKLLMRDCFLAGYDTIGSLMEQMLIR